jgi:2-amino-4-hydroxy-6-hydroxymethyldihydropteridine diphosphokinase
VPTNKVYLALGSNLGNGKELIEQAYALLQERIGPITQKSALYTTAPVGFKSEHLFTNSAICLQTTYSATEVLQLTQQIEKDLGRTHKSVNGLYADRFMDIDILYYNVEQINLPNLIVPHPLMHTRRFVLEPLCDIAPTFKHPILGKNTKQLLERIEP